MLAMGRSAAAGVGHYGVFSGKRWENQVYPIVKNVILSSD
jgi:poly-beta-hydroxyalkanoate depolymerase